MLINRSRIGSYFARDPNLSNLTLLRKISSHLNIIHSEYILEEINSLKNKANDLLKESEAVVGIFFAQDQSLALNAVLCKFTNIADESILKEIKIEITRIIEIIMENIRGVDSPSNDDYDAYAHIRPFY